MITPYVDYTYYASTFLGNVIAQSDFPRLALQATISIDMVTYDRAKAIIDADTDTDTIEKIKFATCACAEVLYRLESTNGQIIQSESVGRASVTYSNPKSKNAQLIDAAKPFLGSTYLMYAGLDDDDED